MSHRVGFGFDIHRFSDIPNKKLVLGGVTFEGEQPLDGHSDSDVVAHAIVDALLGAAGLGDIGNHFPDTDPRWKDVDSLQMLRASVDMIRAAGYSVGNVDCTVVLERPKIAPRRDEIRERLAEVVDAPVNVKANLAEGLGAIGRVEGAACWAVALLESS